MNTIMSIKMDAMDSKIDFNVDTELFEYILGTEDFLGSGRLDCVFRFKVERILYEKVVLEHCYQMPKPRPIVFYYINIFRRVSITIKCQIHINVTRLLGGSDKDY